MKPEDSCSSKPFHNSFLPRMGWWVSVNHPGWAAGAVSENRLRFSWMGSADQILSLHRDIHEVYIIEERVGSYVIVDEASKPGVTLLEDRILPASRHGLLAPIVLLGTATQFGGQRSKLIGIEYENAGLVLASLTNNKLLLVSTKLESLNDSMHAISVALPQLEESAQETPITIGAVTSAAQAENGARLFLNEKFPHGSSRVLIHEVSYRGRGSRWDVQGSHRPRFWNVPRKFGVEIDANDGSVKGFTYSYSYTSSSSLLLFVELACILGAALLAILAFAGLWH